MHFQEQINCIVELYQVCFYNNIQRSGTNNVNGSFFYFRSRSYLTHTSKIPFSHIVVYPFVQYPMYHFQVLNYVSPATTSRNNGEP